MTIASKLSEINTITNNIKKILRRWGLMATPSVGSADTNGLKDCKDVLNSISGTQSITDTSVVDVIGNGRRFAQVNDAQLISSNIVRGATILGVQGTASSGGTTVNNYNEVKRVVGSVVSVGDQSLPNTAVLVETVNAPSGYTGINAVKIYRDNDVIKPENIKNGVTIMGVAGSCHVPQSKSVLLGYNTPTTPITPDSGYDSLSQVGLSIDTSVIKPENIKSGVTVLGVAGTHGANGTVGYRYIHMTNNEYNGSSDETMSISFNIPSSYTGLLTSKSQIITMEINTSSTIDFTWSTDSNILVSLYFDKYQDNGVGNNSSCRWYGVHDDSTIFGTTQYIYSSFNFVGSNDVVISGNKITLYSSNYKFTKKVYYHCYVRF